MKKIFLFFILLFVFSCAHDVNIKEYNDYAYRMVEQNLYNEALFYLKQAEEKKNISDEDRIKLYNNIAICYEALEKKEEAKIYYEKALKIKKEQDVKENYENFKKVK
ncbi:MAG: tetratricopeptide repeat protein [Candidatus Mcinerneyibacterium aminivorans]|uniref:Tetratricopeptide repeat protein n=1 Tax=Candidatus Mcinerneyibacterium aminivorans TaxID=2703815 RepID=A0A5D0MBH8_9BACT|nr:MAG: tetratricopeptide repeat protein [Candidatus Mcinerneyibacterium aminivorans]